MRGDDGAALVEFAFLAPLLFVVLFGIIEFGWTFLQHLDVRHGAREGARLVAVNYDPNVRGGTTAAPSDAQRDDIVNEMCNRMDKKSNITVQITLPDGSRATGNRARIIISKPDEQLTGFFALVLNNITLRSQVDIRLEQDATFSLPAGGGQACS
jgi:Flp pilus assembly protein TadG